MKHRRGALRVRAETRVILRLAAAVLVLAIALSACGAAEPAPSRARPSHAPPASPARSPSGGPTAPPAAGCQGTFVPAFFYSSATWAQAIDTRPAPAAMFLNIDSGPGSVPEPHFQAVARQAQAAGIAVLGYASTVYGQRPIASVEAQVRDYKSWYRVNGIFLDLTQGTSSEFSYYRRLASYIRAAIPGALIWLNPGIYPAPSFMSIANVVMVFEGPYSSYLSAQVPHWVSRYRPDQFADVIYATPRSDFASAVSLARARRAGHLYVTDLPGSPNPYGGLPSYWAREATTVAGGC